MRIFTVLIITCFFLACGVDPSDLTVVTQNEDGSIHIDRLDPGESVTFTLEIPLIELEGWHEIPNVPNTTRSSNRPNEITLAWPYSTPIITISWDWGNSFSTDQEGRTLELLRQWLNSEEKMSTGEGK